MSRHVEEIWLHCSATPWGDALIFDQWHKARGWSGIGYHFVILNGRPNSATHYWPFLDGQIQPGRPLDDDPIFEDNEVGAHVAGRNSKSLGICLVGDDQFTDAQLVASRELIKVLGSHFGVQIPDKLFGHYEDPHTHKTCPNIPMDSYRQWVVSSEEHPVRLQEAIRKHNAALRRKGS